MGCKPERMILNNAYYTTSVAVFAVVGDKKYIYEVFGGMGDKSPPQPRTCDEMKCFIIFLIRSEV